jgi:hypothetical protein
MILKLNNSLARRVFTLACVVPCAAGFVNAGQAEVLAVQSTALSLASSNTPGPPDEVKRLQAVVEAQQRELEFLLLAVRRLDGLVKTGGSAGEIPAPVSLLTLATARLAPVSEAVVAPSSSRAPEAHPKSVASAHGNPCESAPDGAVTPPFIRLGDTCIIPVGFMDLTSVWRDKNAASGPGSNFGSIPFNNAVNGNLSEFRFTPQNSRLGLRVDGTWKGTHFIGYNEFDFNGTSGSNGITVSNGAFVPRLRLFWVDARKGKIEFLAGQSWSMLTPNRKGISALPSDVFYTQAVDVNYMAGLTWTRQPGVRVVYHMTEKVAVGLSAEQPDQYIGGSAGGSGITLPGSYAALSGTQLDAANEVLAAPTVAPDFIGKISFDPGPRFHFEIAGISRRFKTVNPALLSQRFTAAGTGLQFGSNFQLVKNLRLISTNFVSDGGGRYLFGQAPDLVVRANGSLSPVKSDGTIDGLEATLGQTLLYTYYGGIYVGRNSNYDANGKTLMGYGYSGSPNSQNRAIDEVTVGFNRTLWKNPRYGSLNLMGQYEWLNRTPWFVASGSPKSAHDNTVFVNVRYTLPGLIPAF